MKYFIACVWYLVVYLEKKRVKYNLYLFVRPQKNLQIIDERKVCPPTPKKKPPNPPQ
jgi:hypothetical protein